MTMGCLTGSVSGIHAHAADAARNYPNKPVRVMVTFPAGGGVDLMARTLGQKLFEPGASSSSSTIARVAVA